MFFVVVFCFIKSLNIKKMLIQPSKIRTIEMLIETLDKERRVKAGVWNVTCYNTIMTMKATSQFTLIITKGSSVTFICIANSYVFCGAAMQIHKRL